MYRRIFSTLITLLLLGLAVPALAETTLEVPDAAYGEGALHEGDARVESRLIVDAQQVAPGDTFTVGVAFELDTDWHIYWQNPGDAGVPTNIEWRGPQVEFGPLQWSAPRHFTENDGELTVYGYGDRVVLFSEATVSEEASGSVEVGAKVDYLACSDLCMPGHSQLERRIPIGDETIPAESTVLRTLDEFSERVPRRADDVGLETTFHYSQSPLRPGDTVDVVVEVVDCETPDDDCSGLSWPIESTTEAFVPDRNSAPTVRTKGLARHPRAKNGWLLELEIDVEEHTDSPDNLLSGIATLEAPDGSTLPIHLSDKFDFADTGTAADALEIPDVPSEAAVATASTPSEPTPNSDEPLGVAWVIFLAFVGGMILNLMPCVFPVLALKVSSFTQLVHESRRGVLSHGLAYTIGIVGSLLALAGVVVGLKSAGTQVGWGFQFQNPYFLAALAVILTLFALNLFGVFEVTATADGVHEKAEGAKGVQRSFWEGILAVILATPCSAPFLGTAVGFALSSGPATIFAVFASLGLGLAAPFVVLTIVPGWAKVLPNPGSWMEYLKKGLGFALVGSAIWIVWLLGRQTGVDGMASLLMFLGVLSLGAWLYGLVQFQQWSWRKVAATTVGVGAIATAGVLAFPLPDSSAATRPDASGAIEWREWSEDAVRAELDDGRPVFVDFTADWCLTCKVNERNAIDTEPVHKAMAEHDVAMFKADWTNPDERIRQKLAEYGKAGVPFYLMYAPANPQRGTPLPEVITSETVVDAFENAAESK
ncbi:MAG: protein-disulfide reductase DsbD family protein [Myxococcota bacterium]